MARLTGTDQAQWPTADPTQGLAAKLALLRQPGSYPPPVTRVETIEAHMSWVFLTGQHAYKLKKPYRRNGIDYSTPQLRRLNCRRELRLNRRLAEDVYLDVVPLTATADGRLALGGHGRPIEWLVHMRRMPAALTLERRLQTGTPTANDAQRIIARLAPFFATAARAHTSPQAYRRRLLDANAAATAQLVRRESGLDRGRIGALAARLRNFIGDRGDLLDARTRAGCIVEGHGDLRPEHIYLTDPVAILDCIEFDRRLRLRDPVDELAFLAMECDRAGRPEFDRWLLDAYRARSGDTPPRALVEFYKAHNALVRARIAIWHLDDPHTGPPQRWIDRANDYLDRVGEYLDRLPQA